MNNSTVTAGLICFTDQYVCVPDVASLDVEDDKQTAAYYLVYKLVKQTGHQFLYFENAINHIMWLEMKEMVIIKFPYTLADLHKYARLEMGGHEVVRD